MNLFWLAWSNLGRHPWRSVLSLSSVVAGVAVVILGQGVIDGFEDNAIRAQVDAWSGHVVVRAVDYPSVGLDHPLTALAPVSAALEQALEGERWTARTLFVAHAVVGAESMPVRVIATGPRDGEVFPRAAWRWTGDPDGAVSVSTGVAQLLKLEPGDTLVLSSRTVSGAQNALELPVSGVFWAGTPMLDRFGVLVDVATAESLIRHGEAVSHVSVRLGDRNQAPAMAARLAAVTDREVVTWIDETAAVLALQSVRKAALDLILLALFAISATGIANTVLMAAAERTREIGTLQALGMTRGEVVGLFVLEGGLMGVVGAILGGALGYGIVAWYGQVGITLPMALATSGNLPMSELLYLQTSTVTTLLAMAVGLMVAVAASIYPALLASRLTPAEAMR